MHQSQCKGRLSVHEGKKGSASIYSNTDGYYLIPSTALTSVFILLLHPHHPHLGRDERAIHKMRGCGAEVLNIEPNMRCVVTDPGGDAEPGDPERAGHALQPAPERANGGTGSLGQHAGLPSPMKHPLFDNRKV